MIVLLVVSLVKVSNLNKTISNVTWCGDVLMMY
jgi:hypothetical protein